MKRTMVVLIYPGIEFNHHREKNGDANRTSFLLNIRLVGVVFLVALVFQLPIVVAVGKAEGLDIPLGHSNDTHRDMLLRDNDFDSRKNDHDSKNKQHHQEQHDKNPAKILYTMSPPSSEIRNLRVTSDSPSFNATTGAPLDNNAGGATAFDKHRPLSCSNNPVYPSECWNGGQCPISVKQQQEEENYYNEDPRDEYGVDRSRVCDCSTAWEFVHVETNTTTNIVDSEEENDEILWTRRFVGKSCQVEVFKENYCPVRSADGEDVIVGEDKGLFCLNGGTCRTSGVDFPEDDHRFPCSCPAGFVGKHCEYVETEVRQEDDREEDVDDTELTPSNHPKNEPTTNNQDVLENKNDNKNNRNSSTMKKKAERDNQQQSAVLVLSLILILFAAMIFFVIGIIVLRRTRKVEQNNHKREESGQKEIFYHGKRKKLHNSNGNEREQQQAKQITPSYNTSETAQNESLSSNASSSIVSPLPPLLNCGNHEDRISNIEAGTTVNIELDSCSQRPQLRHGDEDDVDKVGNNQCETFEQPHDQELFSNDMEAVTFCLDQEKRSSDMGDFGVASIIGINVYGCNNQIQNH